MSGPADMFKEALAGKGDPVLSRQVHALTGRVGKLEKLLADDMARQDRLVAIMEKLLPLVK